MEDVAASLIGRACFLVQRHLAAAEDLAGRHGPRLWSDRLLVLRAVAKIATGMNPADNFWRPGNRLGAIDLASGRIARVVHGTGMDLVVDAPHPETSARIVGTVVPDWQKLTDMVRTGSQVLAGIRTQSWSVALTANEPVFLELNYGGDFNLHQLAHGEGCWTTSTVCTSSAAATAENSDTRIVGCIRSRAADVRWHGEADRE